MGSTPSKENRNPRASTLDNTCSKGGNHHSLSKKRSKVEKGNATEKSKKDAKEKGRNSRKEEKKNKCNNATSCKGKASKKTKSKKKTQPKQKKKDKYTESRDVCDKERKGNSMSSSSCGETTKRDQPSSLRTDQISLKLRRSRMKTFRINVPASMEPNDIMTLKLGGIQTKILITTPTSSNSTHAKGITQSRKEKEAEVEDKVEACPPSSSSLTSSLIPTNTTKYPDPHSDNGNNVVVLTATDIPEGKLLKEAKPVIVVHATFSEKNQQLKEQMIDETVKEIIQEALNAGCNAILGVMISIKEEKDNSGYLVKACGTPCVLMPAQIRLAPQAKSITCSSTLATRQRASSTELIYPPKVERTT